MRQIHSLLSIAVTLLVFEPSIVGFTPVPDGLHRLAATSAVPDSTGLRSPRGRFSSSLRESVEDLDDEEEIEPGKMRVSEIKAELELREMDFSDCFDKESLVARLKEARALGKADPKILETFNKQNLESTFKEKKIDIKDEDIEQALANDGTLPGGMTPDQFKSLMGNPEIMALLQSTKMQEAMTLMMTGGREELEKKVKDDPELQEVVKKLDSILRS